MLRAPGGLGWIQCRLFGPEIKTHYSRTSQQRPAIDLFTKPGATLWFPKIITPSSPQDPEGPRYPCAGTSPLPRVHHTYHVRTNSEAFWANQLPPHLQVICRKLCFGSPSARKQHAAAKFPKPKNIDSFLEIQGLELYRNPNSVECPQSRGLNHYPGHSDVCFGDPT